MAAVGWVVVTCTTVAALAVVRGFVLSVLWGWFAVPLFGLPDLNVGYAIGLALIVGYLVPHAAPDTDKRPVGEALAFGLGYGVLLAAVVLLEGWIVHLFVS